MRWTLTWFVFGLFSTLYAAPLPNLWIDDLLGRTGYIVDRDVCSEYPDWTCFRFDDEVRLAAKWIDIYSGQIADEYEASSFGPWEIESGLTKKSFMVGHYPDAALVSITLGNSGLGMISIIYIADLNKKSSNQFPTSKTKDYTPQANKGYVFAGDLRSVGFNIEKKGDDYALGYGSKGYGFLVLLKGVSPSDDQSGFLYQGSLMVRLSVLTNSVCTILSTNPKTYRVTLECNGIRAELDYRVWSSFKLSSVKPAKRQGVKIIPTPKPPTQAKPPASKPKQPVTVKNPVVEPAALKICNTFYNNQRVILGATSELPEDVIEWQLVQPDIQLGQKTVSVWCLAGNTKDGDSTEIADSSKVDQSALAVCEAEFGSEKKIIGALMEEPKDVLFWATILPNDTTNPTGTPVYCRFN